jgi:integrase/recombinase XerD
MPNIFKRGKIFWGRIQINGETYRTSLRTGNAAQAQTRYKKWEQELKAAIFDGVVSVVWQEAASEFIEQSTDLIPSAATRDRYFVSLRQVGEYFDDTNISDIDNEMIGRMITARQADDATNATIRRDLTAISWVFRVAIQKKWCSRNPALNYDRAFIPEARYSLAVPTDDTVEAAAKALPQMMGEIVRFAQCVGMRQNEIISLQRFDIGFAVDQHGIPYNGIGRERILQITVRKAKRNKKRVIRLSGPLLTEAVAILDRLPRHITSPYVFWHGDGESYKNFASNFLQQRKDHGIDFRFHDLRHKFAVDYLRRGGRLYDLQLILGHTSVKTTELYLEELDPTEQMGAKHGQGFGTM